MTPDRKGSYAHPCIEGINAGDACPRRRALYMRANSKPRQSANVIGVSPKAPRDREFDGQKVATPRGILVGPQKGDAKNTVSSVLKARADFRRKQTVRLANSSPPAARHECGPLPGGARAPLPTWARMDFIKAPEADLLSARKSIASSPSESVRSAPRAARTFLYDARTVSMMPFASRSRRSPARGMSLPARSDFATTSKRCMFAKSNL